ncbi:MAG: hypothetical protein H6Q19_978 [Bacteroidetes bacterium]|nr:hypothetical protein [Bacteroidota bacterium]
MRTPRIVKNIYVFYRDGFRNMTVGFTLWAIVLIKLFIMFAILRVFFFPNYLNSNFDTKEDKADHVRNELIQKAHPVQPEGN